MVSAVPVGSAASALIRVGLAAVYLLLALALHPLLLEHELALPSDSHHSESDLCAWLDHAAGTSLQSAPGHLIVAEHHAPLVVQFGSPLRSLALFVDPSRGPPILI
jgi:hypothetical protein